LALPKANGQEGTSDPTSLGHAYEILARMLAARLDWDGALLGQTLAPPPAPRRKLDEEWVAHLVCWLPDLTIQS
jgi:hypothetical protein